LSVNSKAVIKRRQALCLYVGPVGTTTCGSLMSLTRQSASVTDESDLAQDRRGRCRWGTTGTACRQSTRAIRVLADPVSTIQHL